MSTSSSDKWAGQRLGLPESGSGSLAKMPRRILAIFIDWGASSLLSFAFFQSNSWITLILFTLMQWLFVATLGGSVGHRVCGLQVRSIDGKWLGIWKPLFRALLLATVIPVAIWDADNRALHDKAIGTVLVLS